MPDSEHIEPLLLFLARAAQRMPALDISTLTCPLTDEEYNNFHFEVCYMAPDEPAFYGDSDDGDVRSRRVYYEAGDWRPSGDGARALRDIGDEWHGGRVVKRFFGGSVLRRGFGGCAHFKDVKVMDTDSRDGFLSAN